jgi:hypothetical protein
MVCDLAIGYETDGKFIGVLDVRGLWLKQKKDGSANFVSFPSKQRLTKEGEAVMDDNNYKVYDNIVDLFMDRDAEKKGPTEAAWGFRKWIIDEMTEAYQQLDKTPRRAAAPPSAPPKPAARPAPAKAPMPTTRVVEEIEDDDESFPF